MKKGIKRIVTAALAAVLMVTQLPAINSKAAAGISIYGKAHVQTYGDTNGKIVKETALIRWCLEPEARQSGWNP